MDTFFKNWFNALDKGLDKMSEQECSRLFSECSSQCAKDALKYLYRDLFDDCEGNLDEFFSRLREIDGVDGFVVQKYSVYEIIFKSCGCDLHTEANINSSRLCECSRQSILWIMKHLAPNQSFYIEKEETILSGGAQCRFLIQLQ